MLGFGKSFEKKVNEAVAQLGSMGVRGANAKVEGKVVTLTGTAHDTAIKARAMAWFNEQVGTENTINMIQVDVPKQTAEQAPAARAAAAAAAQASGPPMAPETNTPITRAEGAAEERIHVVAKGDTLSAISKQYYGKPSDYMKIFNANKDLLKDPDKIYPGQKLRIP